MKLFVPYVISISLNQNLFQDVRLTQTKAANTHI